MTKCTSQMGRRARLVCCAAALAATLLPSPASAQPIGLESLLGSVNDVAIYTSCWNTKEDLFNPEGCILRRGFGVEVLFRVGDIPIHTIEPERIIEKRRLRTAVQIKHTAEGADSTSTISIQNEIKTTNRFLEIELGLGYGQISGVEIIDPRFEMRGTVRELPSVNVYITYHEPTIGYWVQPYAGVKSGLISLAGSQAWIPVDDDLLLVYSGASSSFIIGAIGGLAFQPATRRITFFVEGSYARRMLSHIQWTTHGTNHIPEFLPRELDFTGWTMSMGLQVSLR